MAVPRSIVPPVSAPHCEMTLFPASRGHPRLSMCTSLTLGPSDELAEFQYFSTDQFLNFLHILRT